MSLTNVLLTAVDASGNAVTSATSSLLNKDGSTVRTGTTDGAGKIMFTGISAGNYTLYVQGTQDNFLNYEVKNVYPVVPGSTSIGYEGRTFVQSQVSVPSPGILTQDKTMPVGTSVSGSTVTREFAKYPFSGSEIYSTNIRKGKNYDNRYYHTNTDQIFLQKVRVKVI